MPVPTYDRFIEPVLRYLAAHPEGAAARDVHDAAANALGLSEADRAELLPSGVQRVFKSRAGWAYDRLKRARLSTNPRRGYWQLTAAGRDFARDQPTPLPEDVVEGIATPDNLLQPIVEETNAPSTVQTTIADRARVSPEERLEQAELELRQAVVDELRDQLSQVSPEYFETIVLKVLFKMGYGTSQAALQRVGRVGDGGIDGVISLDRLGLDKVYVQAKRWQNAPVGRPEVQAFYGALAGRRANKGIFITTSSFTPQAEEFAGSVERIVLVDGRKLADLMIEHKVGVVVSRSVEVLKIDQEFFE